ncbi:MAG: hypothetical protein IPM32_17250 [Ignavibacteriae bacterium]|nr:hypothetical protein [Ignavibacteriota bacterium]
MNSFHFEERKNQFLEIHQNEKSVRKSILLLIEFLEELSFEDDENLKVVYCLELLPHLIESLNLYSAFGIEPNHTIKIIGTIKKFYKYIPELETLEIVKKNINRIESELNILDSVLKGNNIKGNLSFPVIEKSKNQFENFGAVEYLQISINKNRNSEKVDFIISPSLPHLEEKLQHQIDTSWKFSENFFIANFGKFFPNLEVTIKFVNKLGIYEGDSLGVALTIGFINELYRFYDLREKISYENEIIATGSVNKNGEIGGIGEDIIKPKSRIAFYSTSAKFILPFSDFKNLESEFDDLSENYPNRKLEILPVKNISDVLNRRDIIKIEKQNILLWSAKKFLKSKFVVLFLSLVITAFPIFYFLNIDKNPFKIEIENRSYVIKNSKNEVLWLKKSADLSYILNARFKDSPVSIKNFANIYDYDGDGKNEVLLTYAEDYAPLILFNHKGEEIWKYFHHDSVETNNEKFTGRFGINGIIDTIHNGSEIEILIFFQHNNYYPNGIMKLNLRTGKQISKILWHSGGIVGAVLSDFNKDGIKEIIAGGISNGMHRAFLFSIDHNKLEGTFPTNRNYTFLNMKMADFNKYILFPLTDMGELYFNKYNSVSHEPLLEGNKLRISVNEGNANIYKNMFWYGVEFNNSLIPTHIVIGDNASVDRDKLVKNGKLNYPLTDTREFRENIMNKIKYWNGKEFVSFFNKK